MKAAMRSGENPHRFDWLAAAIGILGGPEQAARELSISKQTVNAWLNRGLARATFDHVCELSSKSGIRTDFLRLRLGHGMGRSSFPKVWENSEAAKS